MKPKPFSALNHFTVPCGISRTFLLFLPGAAHRHPVYRARSDRHTFVESSELDPTYNPRRNRDRNVDPAGASNTYTEAATALSQSCSPLARQSRNDQVGNNSFTSVFQGGGRCRIRGRISAARYSPRRSKARIPTSTRCGTSPTYLRVKIGRASCRERVCLWEGVMLVTHDGR